MEHWYYDGWVVWFEDEFTYSHFEESHGELGSLVYSCFGEYVDPTVIWLIEKGDGMIYGGLVYSSWPKRRMSVDGQCLAKGEE